MNFFEKFLYAIEKYEMARPGNYGWFHLMFFFIILGITVGACLWFYKRPNDKAVRWFAFGCWAVIFTLEIGKQLIFAFEYHPETNTVEWDYAWYAFPFQLCSSPLYLLPFAAFLPEGKARKGVITFLGTFSLFGGIAVFFYPNDVFIDTVYINIQTMIHHGVQIIIGVLFLSYFRKQFTLKWFLYGLAVYGVMIGIAMILNWLIPYGTEDTFNMFYISPSYPSTLPVLSVIYPLVPYVVFFLLYLLGFSGLAIGIYYAAKGITKLIRIIRARIQKKKQSEEINETL